MELNTVKDAFDRVAKKQKSSSAKMKEVVDLIGREIEFTIARLESVNASGGSFNDCRAVLLGLTNELNHHSPISQIDGPQKELNVGLSKYTKALEKTFNPDISQAYRNVDFDTGIINQIIATHLYRHGLFDLGDSFINEAEQSTEMLTLKASFEDMYRILEALKSRNLEPALNWCSSHRDQLLHSGSKIEFKLHRLHFLDILQNGNKETALQYARLHLTPFASVHATEFQKLIASLLWARRLEKSPYADFLSPTNWENLSEELTREFCRLLGQSYQSPLSVAIAAGVQGISTLLKLASVMAAKKQEWHSMKQLPVPIDLGREFQFHSVFVCPVSREQGSEDNPPMLLPCGHVLCKQSIIKLSKGSTRTFKCPYCPSEATVAQCRQLYF